MNLLFDIGNSRVKISLVSDNQIIKHEVFSLLNPSKEDEKKIKKIISNASRGLLSSVVSPLPEYWYSWITQVPNLIELKFDLPFPFRLDYKTPKTLGKDRMALAAAAFSEFPNQNVLVLDAGTCLTYDFIDDTGCYHGGAISPGLSMRFSALHQMTSGLPQVQPEKNISLIGKSTNESIQSGVVLGMASEIEGVIQRYGSQFSNLNVILTGGDGEILNTYLKNYIFARPNFLVTGLNAILNYNA